MALQKDYETIHGYVANYWRIVNVKMTAKNLSDKMEVHLYKDKASRDAGKTAIFKEVISFPILDENDNIISASPFTLEAINVSDYNPYVVGYDWLNENKLIGAIDILEE